LNERGRLEFTNLLFHAAIDVKLASVKLTMARNERVILDALVRDAVIQPVNEELVNHRARVCCSPTV